MHNFIFQLRKCKGKTFKAETLEHRQQMTGGIRGLLYCCDRVSIWREDKQYNWTTFFIKEKNFHWNRSAHNVKFHCISGKFFFSCKITMLIVVNFFKNISFCKECKKPALKGLISNLSHENSKPGVFLKYKCPQSGKTGYSMYVDTPKVENQAFLSLHK